MRPPKCIPHGGLENREDIATCAEVVWFRTAGPGAGQSDAGIEVVSRWETFPLGSPLEMDPGLHWH
jgi:hypothetical protein